MRAFTFLTILINLFAINANISSQNKKSTDPFLSGVYDYNIVWTNPVSGIDYFLTFDAADATTTGKFMSKFATNNTQAVKLVYNVNDNTFGYSFFIYYYLNSVSSPLFMDENLNWVKTGAPTNNCGFYFIKDILSGLYAIKPQASQTLVTGMFIKVPIISGSNYTTAQDVAQFDIPATGSPFYCFKVLAAALFIPATALEKADLITEYTKDLAYYNLSVTGTAAGQYTAANKTTFNSALSAANEVIMSNTANVNVVNTSLSTLKAALITFKNTINVSINTLANGLYYIFISDGITNFYLTDAFPHTNAIVKTSKPIKYSPKIIIGDTLSYQQFQLTLDATVSRYRIDGKFRLDNPLTYTQTYLNENGFGGNIFYTAWNTYTILFDGSHYAIQKGGSDSRDFWYSNSNAYTIPPVKTTIFDNLVFNFVPVPPVVISGLDKNVSVNHRVYAGIGMINVSGSGAANVTVFDITGRMIKNSNYVNSESMVIPQGQYIVKVVSDNESELTKVIVK